MNTVSQLLASTTPSISVVIPAFNAERTISRTLASVFAQTLQPTEVLVIDDGSRDDTANAVRSAFPAVKLVLQSNTGPGGARNRGISLARGEWIAFIDADDTWRPEKLQRQAAWMNGNFDLVHAFASNTSDAMRSSGEATFATVWRQNPFVTSSVVARKSAIEGVGGFNEDRKLIGVEDYNLWLRLTAKGLRSRCVEEALVDYSPADNNLSSRIEHILSAELANIEDLQSVLDIPADDVRVKQAALYDEYATALLHTRNMSAARRCFREGLRHHPRSRLALGWMATFIPTSVLNLKRRVLSK
jgi:glycosyltransferase involved in cell wall biosynthesis